MKLSIVFRITDSETGEIYGETNRMIVNSLGAFYEFDLYLSKWIVSFKRGLSKHSNLCLNIISSPVPLEQDIF